MERLLPREIEVDIFSRLPAESLIPSKRVCKTWRGVFDDKYFVDVHLRRHSNAAGDGDGHSYYHKRWDSSRSSNSEDAYSTSKVSFLILGSSYVKRQNKSFYYGNYSDDTQQFTYKKLKAKRNNQLFTPKSNYSLVGSCNGLICFSTSHFSKLFISKDPVCVCNPITGEELNLPKYMVDYKPQEDCFNVSIASGFGYVPLTNEYKVVRICYYGREALEVQVYTLGSDNGWKRCKGKIDCLMPSDLTQSLAVYANGSLYWLNFEGEFSIVAFNLAEEDFHIISPPSCFPRGMRHRYQLQVLGGWLTFVHQRRGKYVDIWLGDNNSSQTNQSWGWRKECSIAWEGKWGSEYEPFALTDRGHILFWYNRTILSLYDPIAVSVTILMDGDDLGFKDFQAIPHTNSFVSLKALEKGRLEEEEEECQAYNDYQTFISEIQPMLST